MADAQTTERVEKAYMHPIRTVLAVDDDFHQYGAAKDGAGHVRAKALWRACRERGLLCDVDDGSDLVAGRPHTHLLKSDLVVLDYHLQGEDPRWALDLLISLAESDYATLVVVYTRDDKLMKIRQRIAAHLRGAFPVSQWLEKDEEQIAWDTQEGKINFEPTEALVDAFISGKVKDCKTDEGLRAQLKELGVPLKEMSAVIAAMHEKAVRSLTSREAVPGKADPILGKSDKSPWVYASNLFVVCVQKTKENETDGELVFKELHNALCDWDPNFMLASVAFARGEFARGGFKNERAALSDPRLQAGWLYHAWAGSEEERGGRLRTLFERIVSSYSARVLDSVIDFGGRHVPTCADPNANWVTLQAAIKCFHDEAAGLETSVLHLLNNFLVVEGNGGYIETGTIFVRQDDAEMKQVYVCVTPACDLVPRMPREDLWESQIYPSRPIIALRGKVNGIDEDSLRQAEQAKAIFLIEGGKLHTLQLIDKATPVPILEWFVVENKGEIKDGTFDAVEFSRSQPAPDAQHQFANKQVKMRVLGQIRALYASRIQQYAGQHLSRIGVDFVNLPKAPPPKKKQKPSAVPKADSPPAPKADSPDALKPEAALVAQLGAAAESKGEQPSIARSDPAPPEKPDAPPSKIPPG